MKCDRLGTNQLPETMLSHPVVNWTLRTHLAEEISFGNYICFMSGILNRPLCFNSPWSTDAIWWHRSLSKLADGAKLLPESMLTLDCWHPSQYNFIEYKQDMMAKIVIINDLSRVFPTHVHVVAMITMKSLNVKWKMYSHFARFVDSEMAQITSRGRQVYRFIQHNRYHGCWQPDDPRGPV